MPNLPHNKINAKGNYTQIPLITYIVIWQKENSLNDFIARLVAMSTIFTTSVSMKSVAPTEGELAATINLKMHLPLTHRDPLRWRTWCMYKGHFLQFTFAELRSEITQI